MPHPTITDRWRVEKFNPVGVDSVTLPADFPVFPKDGIATDADLEIYIDGVLKPSSEWSFSGSFTDGISAGGTVKFDAAVTGTVVVYGALALAPRRVSDFAEGNVRTGALNSELDRLWACVREQAHLLHRCIKIPIPEADSDETPVDQVLPALAGRANKTLAFDGVGRPIVGTEQVVSGFPVFMVRDYGAVLDGSTDDTAAINAAISAANTAGGGTVVVDGDAHVSITSGAAITMLSNVRLEFRNDARVTLEPNALDSYDIIRCHDISNFSIIGAHVTGDLDGHTGSTGEHGHCIELRGCTDFLIENCTLRKGWGDGIAMVNFSGGLDYCLRGRIVNVDCDANRRQGMSIIGCDDVEIVDSVFRNTGGTTPGAGIDVEPFATSQRIKGLRINNCVFDGNEGPGLLISLQALGGTTEPVDITVNDAHCLGNEYGMDILAPDNSGAHLRGRVHIVRPFVDTPDRTGIRIRNWDKDGAEITVTEPVILDPADVAADNATNERNGIVVVRQGSSNPPFGNITIVRPVVIDQRVTPVMERAIFCQDATGSGTPGKVRVVDPLRIEGFTVAPYRNFSGMEIIDTFRASVRDLDSDVTLGSFAHWPIIQNSNATATRTITLSTGLGVGTRIVFEVTGGQVMRIDPQTDQILMLTGAADLYIESGARGSRIVLRKIASGLWMPDEIAGVWIAEGGPIPALANSATPSVANLPHAKFWRTGGTTTITDIQGGVTGREITIISEHAITITDGTNLFLNGSVNFTMAATDTLTLVQKADGNWYEVARSVN